MIHTTPIDLLEAAEAQNRYTIEFRKRNEDGVEWRTALEWDGSALVRNTFTLGEGYARIKYLTFITHSRYVYRLRNTQTGWIHLVSTLFT